MHCRLFTILLFVVQSVQGQTLVSHESGFYGEPFELKINASEKSDIFYTTDGSDPKVFGKKYEQSISIGSNATRPPRIDTIPTTPLEGPWQLQDFEWKAPQISSNVAWVLRYAVCEGGECDEKPPETFFIGDVWKSKHKANVISIITDPNNLFQADSGLFIPGNLHTFSGWDSLFFGNGNYTMKGKAWQRAGALQLFDANLHQKYETPMEYRLHGAVVGAFPQKSLRIYTDKSKRGEALSWSLFDSKDSLKLHRFILRNSGSDLVSTHFRDAYLGSIAADLGLEHQKSISSVVYVNGNYWGLFNIRERIDRYYIEEHFGLKKDQYEMIEGTGSDVMNGSNEEYIEMFKRINNEDLKCESTYAYVGSQMDIANYIDYTLFETFFCNMDWPGNNVKFWRPKDGKWRWIFFDGDLMMSPYVFNKDGGYKHDALAHATADSNNKWYNSKGSTYLLRNLMRNEKFRSQLLKRYQELSTTIFSETYLLKRLEDFQGMYAPEIEQHIQRWNYPKDKMEWEQEVNLLRAFIKKRKTYFEEDLDALLIRNN